MALFLFILVAIVIYYFLFYSDNQKYRLFPNDEKRCLNCHNSIEPAFNVCPVCKETLKRKCKNCGERIDVSWKYCPFCENLI